MVRFEKSKLWEAEMKTVLDKASPLQEDHFSCADPQICSQSQYKWKVRAISHLLPAQVWHMTSAATQKPCQDFRTFNSVHFSSVTQLCQNLCDFMERTTPGLPVHHQPPESTQTHVHRVLMPSNHLILCHPLLLLPWIFPRIRVFAKESVLCHQVTKIL